MNGVWPFNTWYSREYMLCCYVRIRIWLSILWFFFWFSVPIVLFVRTFISHLYGIGGVNGDVHIISITLTKTKITWIELKWNIQLCVRIQIGNHYSPLFGINEIEWFCHHSAKKKNEEKFMHIFKCLNEHPSIPLKMDKKHIYHWKIEWGWKIMDSHSKWKVSSAV